MEVPQLGPGAKLWYKGVLWKAQCYITVDILTFSSIKVQDLIRGPGGTNISR